MHGLPLAQAAYGRERCDSGDLPRHRHDEGYMTLVLSGSYVEAGDAGRFRVRPGDLLIHRSFEAHRDCFARGTADVINLPLPGSLPLEGLARASDPDSVARLAERDLDAAAALAVAGAVAGAYEEDWPDLLAAALRRPAPIRIGDWARGHGLAAATVSRGFRQLFGTSPARYRAEARARLAWREAAASRRSLAEIAFELGFADQAHMTRCVSALTGRAPGRWRGAGQMDSRPAGSPRLA
jgi:AraC-like DNA-binding protein